MSNVTVQSMILSQIKELTDTVKLANNAAIETKVLLQSQGRQIDTLVREQQQIGSTVINLNNDVTLLKNDTKTLYRRVGFLEAKKSLTPRSIKVDDIEKDSPIWMTDKIKYMLYILAALAAMAGGYSIDKIPLP